MPSPRRMRLLMLAAVGTIIFIFFYTSGIDSEPDKHKIQDFYHKTKHAMEGDHSRGQAVVGSQTGKIPADKDDKMISAKMQERLRAAEQKAKSKANEKALKPQPPSNIIGVGSSAEGQKKLDKGADGDAAASQDKTPAVSKEEQEAIEELNLILKKSPIIIFSKSYCPFSKRAKGIFLEKYSVKPEPYVVELDEHPLGSFLQDQLKKKTGRRTVPTIMINGVSIGGADEVVELDNGDKLIERVISLGNKHVEMVERLASGDSAHH